MSSRNGEIEGTSYYSPWLIIYLDSRCANLVFDAAITVLYSREGQKEAFSSDAWASLACENATGPALIFFFDSMQRRR